MEVSNNTRTMTISAKVTAYEKMIYTKIAKSHEISFSEWVASILSIYQNGYGELKSNSLREEELLNQIDSLKRELKLANDLLKAKDIMKKAPPPLK